MTFLPCDGYPYIKYAIIIISIFYRVQELIWETQ